MNTMTIYELAERTAEVMNEENWCQYTTAQVKTKSSLGYERMVVVGRCAYGRAVELGGAKVALRLWCAFSRHFGTTIAVVNDIHGLPAIKRHLLEFAATDPARINACLDAMGVSRVTV